MAIIKSGATSDELTIDPTSNAARTTLYNTDGTVFDRSVPVICTVNPVTQLNGDLITSFDAGAYKFVSIQLTGTWAGEVRFQGSNDNGTFEDIVVQNTGSVLTPYVISMTANGGVKIPVMFKFLRVRVTVYTSGTFDGTAFGLKEDANTGQISSIGSVDVNTGSNVIGSVRVLSAITAVPTYTNFTSAATTNETLVTPTLQTKLMTLHVVSAALTRVYFKLFNKTTEPDPGTDTPMITIGIAPASESTFVVPLFVGINFPLGLGFAITLGPADLDVAALTVVGEVTGLLGYA